MCVTPAPTFFNGNFSHTRITIFGHARQVSVKNKPKHKRCHPLVTVV